MEEALLMLLPQLVKAGYGVYQDIQSAQYAKTARPQYNIPQGYTQALNSAQQQALQTQLPGQGLAEEKLGAATSAGIEKSKLSARNPSDILGMVAKLTAQEQNGIRDLSIAAGKNYNANQGVLRAQENVMGGQQATQWKYNQYMPYEDAMKTAAGLEKTGTENIMTGLESFANMAFAGKYYGLLGGQDKSKSPAAGITDALGNSSITSDKLGKLGTGFSNNLFNPSFSDPNSLDALQNNPGLSSSITDPTLQAMKLINNAKYMKFFNPDFVTN